MKVKKKRGRPTIMCECGHSKGSHIIAMGYGVHCRGFCFTDTCKCKLFRKRQCS